MKRIRQIDKACYLKWKAAKKRKEYVLPWGWIMWEKRFLRQKEKILQKMEKIEFRATPIRCPKIEKMFANAFFNYVRETLARIEEQIKAVQK